MPASYDALRLQAQKHFDERLTAAHRQVAQAIAMLVIKAAGSDGLIPNQPRAREALRAAIWVQLRAFYIGTGTDALIGPIPQSPFAKLLVDGITVATRIQAERQVAIVKRVCHDETVVAWLTGPRPSGLLTLPNTALPQRALAGIAFNPSTNTLGGLRGPDGRIDVPRATAALVNPRGNFSAFHEWVDPNGYRLSDRIWRSGLDVRARVDALMTFHIQQGTPAIEIAKLMEPFLTPGGALAKTKTPYGSEGSFSARRLARTEITAAGGKATIQAAAANPFVDSIQWRLSGSHPDADICDENAHGGPNGDGIYPVADVPAYPGHPHCLCSLVPVPAGNTADLVASLRADIQAAKGNLVDAASGGNAERANALRGALNPAALTQSMMAGTLEQDVLAAVESAASMPVEASVTELAPKGVANTKRTAAWGEERINTSDLPLANGAGWNDLNKYRDRLLQRAMEDGDGIDNLIGRVQLDKLHRLANDPNMRLDHEETVYFGLRGDKFADMKPGDIYTARGTRSTTNDLTRAERYAGRELGMEPTTEPGALFQVTLHKGTLAVPSTVLGIDEIMLLPGARFEVVEEIGNVKRLKFLGTNIIDDGVGYVNDLFDFRQKVDAAVAAHARGEP